jgi:hypothetical protein
VTLSATAIINGLVMLRAYSCIQRVVCSGAEEPSHDTCGSLWVYVSVPKENMHEDDQRRMESEGWSWISSTGIWELPE